MSTVELTETRNEYSITAEGHTESKMCAAISCLLYTAAGYISNNDQIIIQEIRLEPGDSRLVWAGGRQARFLFGLMEIGFRQLREGDPENIFIKISKSA